MEQTLLLSPIYEPMTTISWRKAITMLLLSKVEVLEEYERSVHSPSVVLKLPSVVRLISRFSRSKKRIRYSKGNVFARDRWSCQYCGQRFPEEKLTLDHVIPRSRGGKTKWENVVTCCRECNTRKGNRLPEEAGFRLRMPPYRPVWVPRLGLRLGGELPLAWRVYCYHQH